LKDLSASLEDYLETIADIAGSSGEIHAAEIASSMGVSRPSVTVALKALAGKGMINYRPYSKVSLTELGRTYAASVIRRHNVLRRFFTEVLGADRELSDAAACRVEHAIGEEITDRLVQFLGFIDNCPVAEFSGFKYSTTDERTEDD